MEYCFHQSNVNKAIAIPKGITDKKSFYNCYRRCYKLVDVTDMIDFISNHTDNNNNDCFRECPYINKPKKLEELSSEYPGWSFNVLS